MLFGIAFNATHKVREDDMHVYTSKVRQKCSTEEENTSPLPIHTPEKQSLVRYRMASIGLILYKSFFSFQFNLKSCKDQMRVLCIEPSSVIILPNAVL